MKNHATNPAAVRRRRHGEARLERADRQARERSKPTKRELLVLRTYIDAGGVKQAAAALGLADATVKLHLSNVRSKTGAATLAQAVYLLRDLLGPSETAR